MEVKEELTDGLYLANTVCLAIALAVLVKVFLWYRKKVENRRKYEKLQEIGRKVKATRDAKVQEFLQIHQKDFPSKKRMQEIREEYPSLISLRQALDSRKITSKELVMTYIHQAATEGMELNALADVMFEEAFQEAQECDKELQKGNLRGFLHGIPISFKDQFNIKGTPSTIGALACAEDFPEEDGIIAEVLKKHGGIPFAKTNLPQLMGSAESLTRLWGNCCNPRNSERVSGGSSGGEGALLGVKGSPIGIGTDAAGSIRIPSSF